jgi:transcriptional antiterminator NusG
LSSALLEIFWVSKRAISKFTLQEHLLKPVSDDGEALSRVMSMPIYSTAAPEECDPMSSHLDTRWYVVQTCPRHEKCVYRQLFLRNVESFLPLYKAVHRWKDRRKELDLPLFPGYIFVHIPAAGYLKVLQISSVVRLVGARGAPEPLLDAEIESLREGLHRLDAEPCAYLKIGRKVRIRSGPLSNMEGILIRKVNSYRVVLSVDAIMRSIAVEIDPADIISLD